MAEQAQEWWREAIPRFGMRSLFHALCDRMRDRAGIRCTHHDHRPALACLMIGELVFARAGVRVRAGAAHARPGVADRSTMYWEYWRRHRPTIDDSFGWGTNSQWQTAFRRDYRTTRGSLFNLDARSAQPPNPPELTGAEAAEFVKNRCALRAEPDDQFTPPDQMIDERSSS